MWMKNDKFTTRNDDWWTMITGNVYCVCMRHSFVLFHVNDIVFLLNDPLSSLHQRACMGNSMCEARDMDDCVQTKWCRNRGLIETLTVEERLIGMCWVSEWRQSHSHSFSFSLNAIIRNAVMESFFSSIFFLGSSASHQQDKNFEYIFAFLLLPLSCAKCVRWIIPWPLPPVMPLWKYSKCADFFMRGDRDCERQRESQTVKHFNPKNEKCKLFFIISFVIPIFIFVFFFVPFCRRFYYAYCALSCSVGTSHRYSICVFYEI